MAVQACKNMHNVYAVCNHIHGAILLILNLFASLPVNIHLSIYLHKLFVYNNLITVRLRGNLGRITYVIQHFGSEC